MRGYAKISPQFWIGDTGRKLRDAGQEAMLVGLYLLSNPHANMLGLYYLPKLFIAHETGLGLEGASKGLRRAIEAAFCSYDEASEMVFIHEMARYQIADQLAPTDKQCAGIQREYDSLPSNPFLSAFYEKYAEAFHLKTRRENGRASEGASMPLRSQEQEHDQEQEQLKPSSSEQKGRSDLATPLSKKPKAEPSKAATVLACLLKAEILRNKADYKITQAQERSWAVTVDRMLRLDGRKPEEAADLIRWAQRDEFWMANVLSMDTFREKFDQLALKKSQQARSGSNGKHPHAPKPMDYTLTQDEAARRAGLEATRTAGARN